MPEAPAPWWKRYAWVAGVLLLGTIYLFWIYPYQSPPQPVDIRFEETE